MSGRRMLCLALDCPDGQVAVDWVKRTNNVFGVYKIGLELFCAEGPSLIEKVRSAGADEIFLDLKLHDIPRTVERSILRLGGLGADYLTIHASGGAAMLKAAAAAAHQVGVRPLAVTVLTSLNDDDLTAVGVFASAIDAVSSRAHLSLECGISGLVCSAREVSRLRSQLGDAAFLVTPGIRLQTDAVGDQKRVSTPSDALRNGASLLVVGRAVTAASNVDVALDAFQQAVSR